MLNYKYLPRVLLGELGDVARTRLMQSLDAVARSPEGAPAITSDFGQLLTLPLAKIGLRLSRDAHWVLTHDAALRRHELWNDVCRRTEALGRELRSNDLPPTAEERRARLMNIAFFTAAVMVPLLSERGAYRRAVRLAETVRRLVTKESNRLPHGNANGADSNANGADSRLRFLVLSPIIWSLAAFHPAVLRERSDAP
jgi:hypothetical protein